MEEARTLRHIPSWMATILVFTTALSLVCTHPSFLFSPVGNDGSPEGNARIRYSQFNERHPYLCPRTTSTCPMAPSPVSSCSKVRERGGRE
ncbi:uncharacterized protein EV420DRAFT_1538302 [Desarmillaria tabescens]|uniref:Uncharacterized protein n=1 Tax=Armillaria tabescens TaxID=1929756 RepID=A0AA39KDQ4_ARMTA|nr:uncharacterized protein EV420DRAFT_1577890 [Desarmillaria tabescens]XP_060327099.1 uncharacterized protein EV420DRAFT_1564241 [Desarmillaria tabescens]XP_060331328.1 uncharacterized protein EV420DRAFT_1538302 [Desarmillaria tabescens]KAK0442691.1 hypothetical protein EV420DRAFT_1577890 [Desarmillaria tabescens]KAK0449807.1 hypothetical protein EV420DRAFT_1564241 [Desarmillaria tabescens]KAK0459102.1 hypothetical protein EV420DRAFT_1538302 [Desarmillaria tabescens]